MTALGCQRFLQKAVFLDPRRNLKKVDHSKKVVWCHDRSMLLRRLCAVKSFYVVSNVGCAAVYVVHLILQRAALLFCGVSGCGSGVDWCHHTGLSLSSRLSPRGLHVLLFKGLMCVQQRASVLNNISPREKPNLISQGRKLFYL